MSIQQGDYLKELRTKKGLSQEKLAERLGVSRQSVSKGEQGYAVPSSDNVLELSKLYGISADAILNCEMPSDNSASADADLKQPIEIITPEIKAGVQNEKSEKSSKPNIEEQEQNYYPPKKKKHSWLFAAYPCIAVFVTLALGAFNSSLWKTSWIFLLTIPIYYTGSIAIRKKNALVFCYPVVVLIVFLLGGFCANLWHPLWIVFATIPIYYIVAAYAHKNRKRK